MRNEDIDPDHGPSAENGATASAPDTPTATAAETVPEPAPEQAIDLGRDTAPEPAESALEADDAALDGLAPLVDLAPMPSGAHVPIKAIVEAALLASGHPLTPAQLSALFPEGSAIGPQAIAMALAELAEECADRGVELIEVASGFRYQVRREVHPWVSRLWAERPSRYSRALLETLALIAYRQPITRGEIEQIRGVAVNSQIVKTLEEREWVRVVGHRDVPGKPELLGTTRAFLDYFGLKSLDQLPPLAELREIGDLEPELPFERQPLATAAVAHPAELDPPETATEAGNTAPSDLAEPEPTANAHERSATTAPTSEDRSQ